MPLALAVHARVLVLFLTAALAGCSSGPGHPPPDADSGEDVDASAMDASAMDAAADASAEDGGVEIAPVPTNDTPTARTSALFALLMERVERPDAFFGQQYASFTGHDEQFDVFDSDISRALTAALDAERADHPAVYGWNFETWVNGSPALRDALTARLIETDARGGINTIHWPMGNFLIECAAPPCGDNDNDEDVDPIALIADNTYVKIPFTTEHAYAAELFDAKVDAFAALLASLRDASGEPIPIIVRPFHEMNRDKPTAKSHWWAGRDPGQYRAVFRRFVDRLRVHHGLDNLLFAFSPSAGPLFSGSAPPSERYARFWPETDPSSAAGRYVDIAAFDEYLVDSEPADTLFDGIRTTYAFANAPERVVTRVSAIAECGRKDGTGAPTDGGPIDYQNGAFWTGRVLPGLDADGGLLWRRFAFMLTWTNGTFSTYEGAPAAQADDFVAWYAHEGTLFLRAVPAF